MRQVPPLHLKRAFRCNKACSNKVARLSNRRSQHFLIKCSRPVSCKRSLQCNPKGCPRMSMEQVVDETF